MSSGTSPVHSHMIENPESSTHGWIGSKSGNGTSLYLDKMFNELNCSLNPIINKFAWLFRNCSCCLRQ